MVKINKRGIEQPQVIIYVLFVVILTIAGIYVAFTQLNGVSTIFQFHDYASRLNTAAAKLILTPECFAAESSYDKLGTHYQVTAGVIDWAKFNGSQTISSSCISGQQVFASLKQIDGSKYNDAIWTGSEPSKDDLADPKKWSQAARSYFVLIKNNTDIAKGVMTVRLKE